MSGVCSKLADDAKLGRAGDLTEQRSLAKRV